MGRAGSKQASEAARDGAPAADSPHQATGSVGSRTVKGLLWAYGAYVGGRALVLVATAILARLLTPADFGLVAIALVFMTFLDSVRDLGLTQALIASTDDELEEQTQTVFVGTVVLGGLLSLCTAAISPLAAGFFGQPELTAIIPVLAANFFLQALGGTHDALARKALDYRTRTIAVGADVVLRGAIGIGLALAGAGVWSLVLGYIVGTAARDVALWARISWRPSFTFPRAHLRQLMRFGGVLTVVDIAAVVINNMDYLFVGKVLGATSLGLYTIAFRLPELLILNLAIVLGDVLFPSYAAMDRSRLQDGFLLSLRYIAVLVLPMTVALVVLARPAVLTLFGEKFEDSVEVMRLLAVYAVLTAVSIPAGTIYKVTGRGGVLLYTSIPWVIVLFVGLVLLSRHGILAVALVLVGCVGVATVVNLAIASRMLGVSTRTVCAAVAPPVFAAAAMGAAMIPVVKLIGPPVAALVLGALVGVTVYVAVLWILARDLLTQLSGILRSGRASAA